MGATKAVAELVVRDVGTEHQNTSILLRRFGNVLGSQGSMLPIFQRQIADGGPVTVTHRDMTRYFMSISEAVQLVLQAASMLDEIADGCGVFILEMGEPVKILDLARKMIMFAGNGDASRIEIAFTGVRPGERLHESLVGRRECADPTTHPMIRIIRPDTVPGGDGVRAVGPSGDGFREQLGRLLELGHDHAHRDVVTEALGVLLPTYQPFKLDDTSCFPCNAAAEQPG